jgi:predicted metal-dependent peptidase
MSTFNLSMHTHRLLSDEPFLAALSRRIDKRSTTTIPTAGVHVTSDGRYEMLYNPDFMKKMVEECQENGNEQNIYRWVRGILLHEFYHLILGHVSTRLPEGGMSKLWNIATDLAINSHIPEELPEMALLPGRAPFENLKKGLSADAYYEILKEEQQKNKKSQKNENSQPGESGESGESGDPSGAETIDDHSGWEDNSASSADYAAAKAIAEERLKDMMKKAADEANAHGWGTMPGNLKKQIQERLNTKVDWKSVLRSFVKASQKASRRSTVRRINKRFPYIHAGKRAERTALIAISIDQSGSVSDRMLTAFFSELEQLAKFASFVVVPFDTRVDENLVYTWKKGEKKVWERVMCGGTDFDAPTRYVNANNFDGHILLTDMAAPKPIPSKCQRIWMTDSYGATQPYFSTTERVIEIVT